MMQWSPALIFLVLCGGCSAPPPAAAVSSDGGASDRGSGDVGDGDGDDGVGSEPSDGPDGAATGSDAAAATGPGCPESPAPRRSGGTVVEIAVQPILQGRLMTFGAAHPLDGGGTLTLLNLRFYVSGVSLLATTGQQVDVDLVTAAGQPEPYGVHLVNAEDAASTTMRVLAPPGDYTALTFNFGLGDTCNLFDASQQHAPLSAASQMTWPHTGYLFLRYEGRFGGSASADGGTSELPPSIHMGGFPGLVMAPVMHVNTQLAVPAQGLLSRHLRLVMDEIFRGAQAAADLSRYIGPPGPEAIAGEHLRQTAPTLPIFVVAP